ncbi:MAG: hypothetical protein KY476_14955 [Planctomycetes bacterium]|nr:hypothetical protein [Planctomycetota bacterium]
MRPIRWTTENEQKLHAGYIVLLAAILLGVGYAWSQARRPSLSLEVLSQATLDAAKSDAGWNVHLDESSHTSRRQLVVLTVRVMNDGNVDFSAADFASDSLPGFTIRGGELLARPRPSRASDAVWLATRVTLKTPTHVILEPQPLSAGGYVDLTLLAACPSGEARKARGAGAASFAIQPTGSLAGLPGIVLRRSDASPVPSFWQQVVAGSMPLHLARALLYVALGGVAALLLIGVDTLFSSSGERLQRTRRRVIAEYRAEPGFSGGRIAEALIAEYRSGGVRQIERLAEGLQPERLNAMADVHRRVLAATAGITDPGDSELAQSDALRRLSVRERDLFQLCQALEQLGAASFGGGFSAVDDPAWVDELRGFLAYLRGHRFYRRPEAHAQTRKAA